jgi:hypothetical protein
MPILIKSMYFFEIDAQNQATNLGYNILNCYIKVLKIIFKF